ncbi:hypothetical protein FRB90_008920 [Tulasnella sp. 427]|nr:hypothetical protein FRB90_008920 [Tulasnella sp. 427]
MPRAPAAGVQGQQSRRSRSTPSTSSRTSRPAATQSIASSILDSDDEESDEDLQPNQHKRAPPRPILRPLVTSWYQKGVSFAEMNRRFQQGDFWDKSKYGLRTLLRKKDQWGLKSTVKAGWTIDNITPHLEAVRKTYPQAGAEDARKWLFHKKGIKISRPVVLQWMRRHYPEEVRARKRRRLKRKRFWAAGVNDIWTSDQHDKWRRFLLFFHIGLEPVAGKILWLKIWHTNRNPGLVCSWYLKAIEETGGMPLITQSDRGTENYGIANAQTTMRHSLDPTLEGTIQHRFMSGHGNVKPEIAWSQLRRRWSRGWEDLLDIGHLRGLYDPDNSAHRVVFHYIWIPFLQEQLDDYVRMHNNSKKRSDRHKILPHGRPNDIFDNPAEFSSVDLKILVDRRTVDHARELYAPPDDPVYDLVPATIKPLLDRLYDEVINQLPVQDRELNVDNIWAVYSQLLLKFTESSEGDGDVTAALASVAERPEVGQNPNDVIPLLPGAHPHLGNMAAIIGEDGIHRYEMQEAVIRFEDESDQEVASVYDFTDSEDEASAPDSNDRPISILEDASLQRHNEEDNEAEERLEDAGDMNVEHVGEPGAHEPHRGDGVPQTHKNSTESPEILQRRQGCAVSTAHPIRVRDSQSSQAARATPYPSPSRRSPSNLPINPSRASSRLVKQIPASGTKHTCTSNTLSRTTPQTSTSRNPGPSRTRSEVGGRPASSPRPPSPTPQQRRSPITPLNQANARRTAVITASRTLVETVRSGGVLGAHLRNEPNTAVDAMLNEQRSRSTKRTRTDRSGDQPSRGSPAKGKRPARPLVSDDDSESDATLPDPRQLLAYETDASLSSDDAAVEKEFFGVTRRIRRASNDGRDRAASSSSKRR